jgi:hypothetical protein
VGGMNKWNLGTRNEKYFQLDEEFLKYFYKAIGYKKSGFGANTVRGTHPTLT